MEERFKSYLEAKFRQIAPTKAAMEYRKSLLIKLTDRAQELRIKGMTDDELIYGTVITELGDFDATLRDYESRTLKRDVNVRIATFCATLSALYLVALVAIYLIVGFVARIWHPTWLIIVGGILVALTALSLAACAALGRRRKFVAMRASMAAAEILLGVTVFLFLQLVGGIRGSYMTFLVMTAVIFVADTAAAFASGSRFRWAELPVSIEAVSVMLYVTLGIGLSYNGISIWHPAWIICLTGIVAAFVHIMAVIAKRARERKREDLDGHTVIDEEYWTKW